LIEIRDAGGSKLARLVVGKEDKHQQQTGMKHQSSIVHKVCSIRLIIF
jgi:hypothetical protein